MKVFEKTVGNDKIRVENKWDGEKLFVNDELQDEQLGFFVGRSRLYGKLSDGKVVKVSLGGTWTIDCRIFVDDKLV